MNYEEIWEDICFQVNKCKIKNCKEQEYQFAFERIFQNLGWLEMRGELVPQHPIRFGSTQTYYADIVIKNDNNTNYIVELKRPNVHTGENHLEQLRSYMVQLDTYFGILIGDTLQVYFGKKQPIMVCDIPFAANSQGGIEIISMLSKSKFSNDLLKEFCNKQIENESERQKIKTRLSELCSNKGQELLYELLGRFLAKEFLPDDVKGMLDEVEISIRKKGCQIDSTTDNIYKCSDERGTTSGRDATRYVFNGINYPKNRLVWAIVNSYAKQNNVSNVSQLKIVFPNSLQGKWVVENCDVARRILGEKEYPKRFFTRLHEIIKLQNENVVVSTQWGIGNIDRFVAQAKKLGFDVKEIK